MTTKDRLPPRGGSSRREFLAGAGAAAALSGLPDDRAKRSRHRKLGTGAPLNAQIFPISQPTNSGPYPEQLIPRYSAAAGKWGVSFSGGGSRAFSAALGQMRGLYNANMVDNIGAISCVSGGTWFGAPYTFAPPSITDDALLGPLVQPGDIVASQLGNVPPPCLGSLMGNLRDLTVAASLAKLHGTIPADKLYSRMLNIALLAPYQLSDTQKLVTLNQTTEASIKARNPGLTFQLPKADRPFFIAGASQIFEPLNPSAVDQDINFVTQVYRNVEYTPYYAGAPQFVPYAASQYNFGGGYVESFAFDTPAPQSPPTGNLVSVPAGANPFLLSDIVGSSSAAIEAYVDNRFPQLASDFPQFSCWPIPEVGAGTGPVQANTYSIGDGGTLENTGVVSLLRRGYQTIFAFVNSSYPLGSQSPYCSLGVDGDISRLFGVIPLQSHSAPQPVDVFDAADFLPLANFLTTAGLIGALPVYASTFRVKDVNPFGIAPYSPRIFWIYNFSNNDWYSKLPQKVVDLFKDPIHQLGNFPNYETVFQNPGELLFLTPTQVNLIAHLWAYTVYTGFQKPGSAFGLPIG